MKTLKKFQLFNDNLIRISTSSNALYFQTQTSAPIIAICCRQMLEQKMNERDTSTRNLPVPIFCYGCDIHTLFRLSTKRQAEHQQKPVRKILRNALMTTPPPFPPILTHAQHPFRCLPTQPQQAHLLMVVRQIAFFASMAGND